MAIRNLLLVAVASLVAAITMSGQWPEHPTKGIPMKDGQPDLNAPAPRMPDGKVDFTGLWENNRGGGGPGGGAGKGKDGGKGKAGADKGKGKQAPAPAPATPPLATFFNIGAGFPNGLPLQPWAAELLAQRTADHGKDNPDAHCLPMGLMQYHLHPQPRKIIQTKDVLVILYEANSGIRQVYLDGRSGPPADVDPWWFGYSVGRWDGDTLVVETTMLRDLGWLDVNGSPITTEGKTIERFRRPSFGRLEIDVTIDDPKAYTAPFTVRVAQQILLHQEMIEFICQENERDAPHLVGKE